MPAGRIETAAATAVRRAAAVSAVAAGCPLLAAGSHAGAAAVVGGVVMCTQLAPVLHPLNEYHVEVFAVSRAEYVSGPVGC